MTITRERLTDIEILSEATPMEISAMAQELRERRFCANFRPTVRIPQWMKDRHMRCWDPDDPRDTEEFEQQEREVEAFLAEHGLTEEDLYL